MPSGGRDGEGTGLRPVDRRSGDWLLVRPSSDVDNFVHLIPHERKAKTRYMPLSDTPFIKAIQIVFACLPVVCPNSGL